MKSVDGRATGAGENGELRIMKNELKTGAGGGQRIGNWELGSDVRRGARRYMRRGAVTLESLACASGSDVIEPRTVIQPCSEPLARKS